MNRAVLQFFNYLAVAFCIAVGTPALSGELCEQANSVEPWSYARPVQGDLITFMRSNPAWSWAWFASHCQNYGNEIGQLASFTGVVAGDVKPDNVDLASRSSKRKNTIGLVDLDDGGRGSFLGDVFHTLSYNGIWHTAIGGTEALEHYRAGLAKAKSTRLKDLEPIGADRRMVAYRRRLLALEQSEALFLRELKLTDFHDLNGENRDVFDRSKSFMMRYVQDLGSVVYGGVRIKETGGSMGVPRFAYLIRTSGNELRLLEFKFQPDPAVAASGALQAVHADRIADLLSHYRPENNRGNILGVLETPAGVFIVREPLPPLFDGGMVPKGRQANAQYRNYVRHMFYWLGEKHGAQDLRYVAFWLKHQSEVESRLLEMVADHIQDSTKLQAQSGQRPENSRR